VGRMKAVDAAVLVLEREGVSVAFGVPGAAINPLYAALRQRGSIRRILARHVAVAEGLGSKAIRVKSPNEFKAAFARAKELMAEYRVPVVLEFILERVTNISMGTEISEVNEFEEILCLDPSLSIRKSQDMGAAEPAGTPAEAVAEKS